VSCRHATEGERLLAAAIGLAFAALLLAPLLAWSTQNG
jgi:hypothetical protein